MLLDVVLVLLVLLLDAVDELEAALAPPLPLALPLEVVALEVVALEVVALDVTVDVVLPPVEPELLALSGDVPEPTDVPPLPLDEVSLPVSPPEAAQPVANTSATIQLARAAPTSSFISALI